MAKIGLFDLFGLAPKPKRRMRTKGTGTARSQLAARQGTGVTALSKHPAALSPKAYRRSKKVWP